MSAYPPFKAGGSGPKGTWLKCRVPFFVMGACGKPAVTAKYHIHEARNEKVDG
jgi:hypothetical protein